MNKQWMALLLSAGMAVTTCPVPGAQEPPAEQIHTEQAEESSAAVHSDDSDREGTAADEFQSETEPSGSETETGAYEEETSENENKKDNGTMLDYTDHVFLYSESCRSRGNRSGFRDDRRFLSCQ